MPRKVRHGAAHSNVGHAALYEAQDQRNEPQSVINERNRYADGKVETRGQNADASSTFY